MELGIGGGALLAGGILRLALAGGLAALGPASRPMRAFALYLLLSGLWPLAQVLRGLAPDAAAADFWGRLIPYAVLPIPFIALYFTALYPRPRRWLPKGALGPALFLLPAAALDALYAWDHRLFVDLAVPSTAASGGLPGPLYVLGELLSPVFVALAIVLARDAVRARPGPRRTSPLLVSFGFALPGLYFHSRAFGTQVRLGFQDDLIDTLPPTIHALLFVVLAAYLWVRVRPSDDPALARAGRRYLAVLAVVPALGQGLILAGAPPWASTVVLATTSAALPLMVAYALARHRIFGLDLKVHWTVRSSTVVGAFVVAFVAASEVAEIVVSETIGPLVGLAAAGALGMVQGPLQRWAERVADLAVPGARMARAEGGRAALYQSHVRAAWEDGALDLAERARLRAVRDRLGLTSAQAEALEQAALRDTPP